MMSLPNRFLSCGTDCGVAPQEKDGMVVPSASTFSFSSPTCSDRYPPNLPPWAKSHQMALISLHQTSGSMA